MRLLAGGVRASKKVSLGSKLAVRHRGEIGIVGTLEVRTSGEHVSG